MNICSACYSLLRGAGQVMFMEKALTGALFLAGIAVGSWLCGTPLVALGAVVGLVVSTVAGWHVDRHQGLSGFNGVLIGCALPTLFADTAAMWTALVLLSACSPWLRVAMNKAVEGLGINSLTLPFIMLTWLAWCLGLEPVAGGDAGQTSGISLVSVLEDWLGGISQVFLVCSPVCGALFLAGLLVADRRAAAWCAVGSAAGLALAFVFGQSHTDIMSGLYGFNPALTAIALGAVFRKQMPVVAAGIVATFFIQLAVSWLLSYVGVPALTFPFCVATWLSIYDASHRLR